MTGRTQLRPVSTTLSSRSGVLEDLLMAKKPVPPGVSRLNTQPSCRGHAGFPTGGLGQVTSTLWSMVSSSVKGGGTQHLLSGAVLVSCSLVSDSLRPFDLQPSRLFWSGGFPGRNPGVGGHFLLHHGTVGRTKFVNKRKTLSRMPGT